MLSSLDFEVEYIESIFGIPNHHSSIVVSLPLNSHPSPSPTIEFKEIALQLADLDLTYQEGKKWKGYMKL